MTTLVTALFVLTYVGLALGRVPGLRLDRTGIVLVSAVILVGAGAVSAERALAAVDFPTLATLFGLMVLSSQFALAGFYDACAARIAAGQGSPRRLLALTIAVSGLLSALLANDVVVFAMTPLLCAGVQARGLDPRPFLAGLVGAANAGSAATVIGNPQNILIGQVGDLPFWGFLAVCGPPAVASLVLTWLIVTWVWRAELRHAPAPPAAVPPLVDRAALTKGVVATMMLIALFAAPIPHALAVVLVASTLLVSRHRTSREVLAGVDWHMILLFVGLFIVNAAFEATGSPAAALSLAREHGLLPDRLATSAPFAALASNTIGNVPAVVLLLGTWPDAPTGALYGLALLTTLAGNLLLVGSIANLILAERAATVGVRFSFRDHARAGVPLGLATLALACVWLGLGGWMPWA